MKWLLEAEWRAVSRSQLAFLAHRHLRGVGAQALQLPEQRLSAAMESVSGFSRAYPVTSAI
jgi:hypothetical protein